MRRLPTKLVGVWACACALAAVLLTVSAAAASSPRQVRVGSVTPLPRGARAVGALPDSTPLRATVTLEPRDPAALAAYAAAVSTPGSDVYHRFLSVTQFAQQFGPGREEIKAVQASLRAHGLDPGPVSANGLAIPVAATAATMGHAFSTSFKRFSLPSGRTAFASTQAPLLDASVTADVEGVIGLDDLAGPQPLALRHGTGDARPNLSPRTAATPATPPGPQPCSTAKTDAQNDHVFTANQIASAYGYTSLYTLGDEGAGQTIALYELEPDSASDIAAFQSCYGTNASVSYVTVDGGAGQGAGLGEAALDIEQVISLAPQANVIVYQGPNSGGGGPGSGPYDTYNAIISQDVAKVISTSWGECEADEGSAAARSENTLFEEAAVQGQTILAAAGDDGSEDCFQSDNSDALAVDDPGSQPYVTGVGGTELSTVGPPPSETVWNTSGASGGAGGGGISTLWPMPTYQSAAASSLNVINAHSLGSPCGASSGYCREVPDVSADADPATGYLVYWNGADTVRHDPVGWQGFGGTSAGAPLWAALVALANSSSYCAGKPSGFANPALYQVPASTYSHYFNDVTTGNNDYTGAHGGSFPAGTHYDMASGLGTPIASALATVLCGKGVSVSDPGPQSSLVGAPAALQITAIDAQGKPMSYAATGLPPGLSINPATGLISGSPSNAAIYGATVTVTDSVGEVGAVSFNWTTLPATVTVAAPGSQRGRVGLSANLQIYASDNNGGALSFSASGLPGGLSVNGSTGLISGTLSAPGSYFVTVLATSTGSPPGSTGFAWTISGPPRLSRGSLAGIAAGKPRLAFTISAGIDAPAIPRIAIRLPRELRFSGPARMLAKEIVLRGPNGKRLKFKAKVVGGVLTIALARATTRAQITIGGHAIHLAGDLTGKTARKRIRPVDVTVKATDSSQLTTTLVLKLKPS